MNKKEKIKSFFLYLVISFCLGAIFYRVVYTSDAYNIVGYDLETYNVFALGNMRPLQYVITKGFMWLLGSDIKYEIIYSIYLTITLVLLALSMYLVYTYLIKIINENERIPKLTKLKKGLIFVCIIFMFFNRYLSDNLVYLENLTMILSLFLAVVASILYSKNIKYKNVICLILLIISEFSYQTMITTFIILSLIFYAIKSNKKIDFKYLIKASILFVIPLILLFIFSKYLGEKGVVINDRYSKLNEYIMVFAAIGVQLFIYIMKYILYYFIFSIIFNFVSIDKEKKYITYNLIFILITAALYTYSFAIINGAYMSNRMAWNIGAISSIICLFIIIYRDDIELKKKRYKVTISLFLLIELVLFYSLYGIYTVYNNKVENNCKYVINYIEKWNSEHEEKIDRIALYKDESITESEWFSIVPYLTLKIYNIEESFYTQFKIYSNNKYYEVEPSDEIFNRHFKGKDWQEFDLEQFVVYGNTLHMCKF